jgi:hypothetical protein
MEDEHRGIKYSVVRGKGGGWEWRASMGDPEVLITGEALTAYHADLKVRQVIDRPLARSLKPRPPSQGAVLKSDADDRFCF